MKGSNAYRKLVYWLSPDSEEEAVGGLQQRGVRVHRARNSPCEALYARREAVVVAPGVWDRRCSRQGSWYRASSRRGETLLVLDRAPDGREPWGEITLERFTPPRLARDEDVLELLRDPDLLARLPEGWGLFSPWEREAVGQYLAQAGIQKSLPEVFAYYTANHLNFLRPRFHVSSDRHPVVPYSIQQTALVCSACVELFGVLGAEHPEKVLVPCPGLKYVRTLPGDALRVRNSPTRF